MYVNIECTCIRRSLGRLLRYSCNDDVDGAGDAVDADDDDAVNDDAAFADAVDADCADDDDDVDDDDDDDE
jgi:hypothetical protein